MERPKSCLLRAQSVQSVRLLLQSSELAPPSQLHPQASVAPPFGSKGGHTRLRERGNWVPIQTLWYTLGIVYNSLRLRVPARERLSMNGRQKDRKGRTEKEYTK